jgi:hypothetical protein
MNLAIVLVVSAVCVLGVILRLAVSRSLLAKRSLSSITAIHSLDVEAFRNLINPAEDQYLRRRLPPAQFRQVRRARLRAMAAYIQVAGNNAAVLVGLGEAALAGGDPRVAGAARQLIEHALLLRRNTTMALARIYVALALPSSNFAAVRVVERYEQVSGSAMLLGRLQNPGAAVRLSARI